MKKVLHRANVWLQVSLLPVGYYLQEHIDIEKINRKTARLTSNAKRAVL